MNSNLALFAAQLKAALAKASDAELATFFRNLFQIIAPPAPTPPSTPAGLAASAANPVVLTLSTPSTDPVAMSGYEVWRGLSSGAEAKIATSAAFPYTDSSVAPSTTYFYKVRAFDPAGLFSAFSNEVSAAVPGGLAADTTAPLTGSVPTMLSVSTTSIVLALPLTTDSTVNSGTQLVSGMKDGQVYVGGVAVGSPVSQPSSALAFSAGFDIGSPVVAGSDSVSTGIYTIHAGGTGMGGTSDQCHVVPSIVVGDFDVTVPITSISGGTPYARFGIMARDGFDPAAVFFAVETFQDQSVGFDSLWRGVAGQAASASGKTVLAIPQNCRIRRQGNVFTAYIGSTNPPTTQINQQTIPANSALRLCLYGTASDYTGPPPTLSATGVMGPVSLTGQTAAQFTDTFAASSSPTTRLYTDTWRDNALNVSAQSPSVSITPTASGGSGIHKFNAGMGMTSGVFTCLGNLDESGNPLASVKANEISVLRAGPAISSMYGATYFWRAMNNGGAGVIDGSQAGCGLDADYVQVTGYQSGTAGVGAGPVYSSPRRMGIWILAGDFFSTNPVVRILPDYVANNSALGPLGPDGVHYGYFTQFGAGGNGHGCVAAYWRSSVCAVWNAFLQALANHVLPDGYSVDTSPYIEFVLVLGEASDTPTDTNNNVGNAADPSYSTEAAYFSNLAGIGHAAAGFFPHTSVVINNNYSSIAANMQTLSASMAADKVAFGAGDTFGFSSGQNFPTNPPNSGLAGPTFAQLIFMGFQPPAGGANPFTNPWTPGGTVYEGVVPFVGGMASSEMLTVDGIYYTTLDAFKQANFFGYSHFMIQYLTGNSGLDSHGNNQATANWVGNGSGVNSSGAIGDTLGGALTTEVNNTLSNSSRPTGY